MYVQQHNLSRQHQFDQPHFLTIKRKLLLFISYINDYYDHMYLSLLRHIKKLNVILILKFCMTLYNSMD
jgi:hypothetical protein